MRFFWCISELLWRGWSLPVSMVGPPLCSAGKKRKKIKKVFSPKTRSSTPHTRQEALALENINSQELYWSMISWDAPSLHISIGATTQWLTSRVDAVIIWQVFRDSVRELQEAVPLILVNDLDRFLCLQIQISILSTMFSVAVLISQFFSASLLPQGTPRMPWHELFPPVQFPSFRWRSSIPRSKKEKAIVNKGKYVSVMPTSKPKTIGLHRSACTFDPSP